MDSTGSMMVVGFPQKTIDSAMFGVAMLNQSSGDSVLKAPFIWWDLVGMNSHR